jgi:hypothetical protein
MDLKLRDKPDVDKAKNIICALVHLSGGRFEGKTRLNKAFWRAHVFYYKNGPGLLTKYPIARLPEGPAIDDLDAILASLEREGRIKQSSQTKGDYNETIITLTSNAPKLENAETDAVKDAFRWIRQKTAAAASKESHKLSIGWEGAENGDIIDVEFDALDISELETIKKEKARIVHNVEWAKSFVGDKLGK